MNLTQWYAISLAATVVLLIIYRIGYISSTFLIARFQVLALRHFIYPLLVQRRYWTGVTRLQGLLVGGYLAINGFCMGLGVKTMSDVISRAGIMASVNIVPLFLGGRTNTLANFIGISIHSYYIAHHWIGRVVIVQSLLHVGFAIAAGQPWTFNSSQISGISAASALSLLLITSMFFLRRLMFEVFLKIHFLLAFIVIIALMEHVAHLGLTRSMFPIIALSLWSLNAIMRWGKMFYDNVGGVGSSLTPQADIFHYYDDSKTRTVSAIRLTVLLKRPMKIYPGQYMYLFLSDMGVRRRFQAHPFVIAWWDDSMKATKLSFLIEPSNGLTSDLVGRGSLRRVVMDGPYGKDLRLEDFENVILVAKGIGIAGIIPYVRSLTYRRVNKDKSHESYRRGLITRKIDLYWILEDNCQEDWISDWLVDLQMRDSEKIFLNCMCFYPHKIMKPPPIVQDPHWRFVEQQQPIPIIEGFITKQVQRSAGRSKVAVCGTSGFTHVLRNIVIETLKEYDDVEYAEVEYQPHGVHHIHSGVTSKAWDQIEMEAIKFPSRFNTRGRRLQRPQLEYTNSYTRSRKRSIRKSPRNDRLIEWRSGASNQLTTLEEADEKPDEKPDEVQDWKKMDVREIV
ncbi:hypothetical protein EAE96_010954 [Botrytis aclada]|nr:hypothetical protein EAE96_010954 [Botrytis aclada]